MTRARTGQWSSKIKIIVIEANYYFLNPTIKVTFIGGGVNNKVGDMPESDTKVISPKLRENIYINSLGFLIIILENKIIKSWFMKLGKEIKTDSSIINKGLIVFFTSVIYLIPGFHLCKIFGLICTLVKKIK